MSPGWQPLKPGHQTCIKAPLWMMLLLLWSVTEREHEDGTHQKKEKKTPARWNKAEGEHIDNTGKKEKKKERCILARVRESMEMVPTSQQAPRLVINVRPSG